MLTTTILLLAIYVLAGVNFALLLAGLRLIPDPRSQGSGNPGVSNVYRTAGPLWAALVLILDVGRALGAALLCLRLTPGGFAPWGAPILVFGNMFPVFHRFRGGKGVANFIGFTIGVTPLWGALALPLWPASYAILRKTWLCSFLLCAALGAAFAHRFGDSASALAAGGVTLALIVWAHRTNFRSRSAPAE